MYLERNVSDQWPGIGTVGVSVLTNIETSYLINLVVNDVIWLTYRWRVAASFVCHDGFAELDCRRTLAVGASPLIDIISFSSPLVQSLPRHGRCLPTSRSLTSNWSIGSNRSKLWFALDS